MPNCLQRDTDGKMELVISKSGCIGVLALLLVLVISQDLSNLFFFTANVAHIPKANRTLAVMDPKVRHSRRQPRRSASSTVSSAPRESSSSFPSSSPPQDASPPPQDLPPLFSLYNETTWMYPFTPLKESYREPDDVLPDSSPSSARRPARPKAVLLTHDNREWSKAGGYMTYLHLWNFLYSQRHGDKVHFLYYRMLKGDILMEPVDGTYRGEAAVKSMNRLLPLEYQVPVSYSQDHCEPPPPGLSMSCRGSNGCYMWNSWCKVKAMRHAMALFPETDLFLYIDSDAVIGPEYKHISIPRYAQHIQTAQGFDLNQSPVVIGQELGGVGWNGFCMKMWAANLSCFNSGVVFAKRTPAAQSVLDRWWELSMAVADCPPGGEQIQTLIEGGNSTAPVKEWMSNFACTANRHHKFHTNSLRWRWPGEQPSLAAMFADPHWRPHIKVSWPDKPKYVWNVRHRKNRTPEPPLKDGPLGIDCLQHYPQAHCFIQHFFAGDIMKTEESLFVRSAVLRELRNCDRVFRLLPRDSAHSLCGRWEGEGLDALLKERKQPLLENLLPKWESEDEEERIAQLARLIAPLVDHVDMA